MAIRSVHTHHPDALPLVVPRARVDHRTRDSARSLETAGVGAVALTSLRVVAGLAFWSHGAQKLFGWFGGMGPEGGSAELMSRYGVAGGLEMLLGTMIIFGILSRLAAFIGAGEMAVAYFWIHVAGSGSIWWWTNGGELAMLYAFIWLYFAAVGAGPLSLDAAIRRRKS